MLDRHKLNLRRAARAAINISAGAGYSEIALYNDSTGADLLYVRAVSTPYEGGVPGIFVTKGIIGANPIRGVPVVTGEAQVPGQVTAINNATLPTPDFYLFALSSNYQGGSFNLEPLAILQPGWSLVVTSDTGVATLYVAFYWFAIHIEDLQGRHCQTCDGAPAASP